MKFIIENILLFLLFMSVVSCGKSTSSMNDFQVVRGIAQNETIQTNEYLDLTVEQTDPQKAQNFIAQKKLDFNEALISLNSKVAGQISAYYPRSDYLLKVVRMPSASKTEKIRIDVGVEVNNRRIKIRLRRSDIYPEFRDVINRKLSSGKMMEYIHNTIYKIISTTILIDDRVSLVAIERYFKETYFSAVGNGQFILRSETKIENESLEINDSSVEVIAQVYRDL